MIFLIIRAIHRKRLMDAELNYNNGVIGVEEYDRIYEKEMSKLLKLEQRRKEVWMMLNGQ